MNQREKLMQAILSGRQDRSFQFFDLCTVLEWLGFQRRVKGDHFIFTRSGVEEIINIQPLGSKAKPYQVRQVRELILKYKLGGQEHE